MANKEDEENTPLQKPLKKEKSKKHVEIDEEPKIVEEEVKQPLKKLF